jgi:2-polyprenyl-3-methyl-5-hydroxy-6-metoxy-1,4-benzoquinol methylase
MHSTQQNVQGTIDLSPNQCAPVLDALASEELAAAVASQTGRSMADVQRAIADIGSEANLALSLLRSLEPLPRTTRILEVGAGAGVVSGILHSVGARVTAIEPLIGGFELFAAVRTELVARVPSAAVELDRRSAIELDGTRDGPFDLIFSVNVLEHVHPLAPSLDALAAVLAPGGTMLHTCPNYRVPYEPHFASPLVPFVPSWTARVRRELADNPLWQSLNFITAGDIARFAARHNLHVQFRAGVFADAIERLANDPAFARRQGWAGRTAAALGRTGALRLLRALPATWLTPMVFEVHRPIDSAGVQ